MRDLEPATALGSYAVQLSGTRLGARLARQLAARQLDTWGITADHPAAFAVTAVTAELAANAVTHGRRRGRDFHLRLLLLPEAVRVEVADTRPDRLPHAPGTTLTPVETMGSGPTPNRVGLLLAPDMAADPRLPATPPSSTTDTIRPD